VWWCLGVLALVACGSPGGETPSRRLMEGMSGQDATITQACELTAQRCTACHDLDRVIDASPSHPDQWARYIGRMRRMRGSGISVRDGDVILRCLVYRSFGDAGLRTIESAPPER
jgi:hypothetical protein